MSRPDAARPLESSKPLVQRSDRKPLYVQVLTRPALPGCWSVNISATGIGLVARGLASKEGPREGDELFLSFTLPGSGARVEASGTVRWRHEGGGEAEGRVSLGVSFNAFEGQHHLALFRYLVGHRPQVLAAFPSAEEERLLSEALEGSAGLHVARTAPELQALIARGDLAALCVFGADERRAIDTVETLRHGAGLEDDLLPRVLYCARADPAQLLALFNSGALFRAVPPPFDAAALRTAVDAATREHGVRTEQRRVALELERNLLRDRALSAPAPVAAPDGAPGLGSPPMRRVMELLRVAAPHRVAILLQGETGTGKEVLARAVHAMSGLEAAPFVVQDCGALTETLLASELFGHVKGSFTGAVADHPGLFVMADGGTIFLDEIENTTPDFQAKLLRVLETGDVRPVGGTQVRHVTVRVIAACNTDLEEEVRRGRFRADLFYRLNSFTVEVPPLRERREDILPLVHHFIGVYNRELKKSASGVTDDAKEVLLTSEWPGNVRELRNLVERAVLLSRPGAPLTPAELPDSFVRRALASGVRAPASGGTMKERLEEVERAAIREALDRHGGVLRRAAASLAMDPVTFGRRAKRYGLYAGMTPVPPALDGPDEDGQPS